MREWLKSAGIAEWFCALFFVFLACVSCFCTTQSLCLSIGFRGWAMFVIVFLITLAIYGVTSFFLVRIWNYNNLRYCKKNGITEDMQRNWTIGGFLMVALFWLIFSFPTNTHNLVYQQKANSVARAELGNQLNVFQKAENSVDEDVRIRYKNERIDLRNTVISLQGEFDREIDDDGRPGLGPRAKEFLAQIEEKCTKKRGIGFHHTTQRDRSPKERTRIKDYYHPQIAQLLSEAQDSLNISEQEELKLTERKKIELNVRVKEIYETYDELDAAKETWNFSSMSASKSIEEAKKLIQKGYNDPDYKTIIMDNVFILKNKNPSDESKKYDYNNVQGYNIYSIERLYNAREVWQDFLAGKLPVGFDMLTWILLSAILDIVAFILSVIAFRSKNNQTKQTYKF
ncbi:MAG: hypothetical protein J1E57_05200 [Prevotella sp.]|nr:hypothetical protein [Prevotella sp.]